MDDIVVDYGESLMVDVIEKVFESEEGRRASYIYTRASSGPPFLYYVA